MSSLPNALLSAIEQLVQESTATAPPLAIDEILGGASLRRFFRVKTAAGGSVVIMYVPVQSHEIAKVSAVARPWPFLEVRALLEERGIRVPKLLGSACERGLIAVEDLGDTLAQHLTRSPEAREQLYVSAVRGLARAQRALWPLPPGSIVQERAFDEDLLRWEVDHFREWALEARGIELRGADRETFDAAAAQLARTIAGWQRGFVHRDYQSRNLMVVGDGSALELGWVDFQDAMLGPRIYDLVALLSDSYQSFTKEFVEARLDDFAAELGLGASERALLGYEFQVVTVQRKLKDAGRFVFFERKNQNPNFLPFVEPTILKAQLALETLQHDPVLAALSRLLDRLFPR